MNFSRRATWGVLGLPMFCSGAPLFTVVVGLNLRPAVAGVTGLAAGAGGLPVAAVVSVPAGAAGFGVTTPCPGRLSLPVPVPSVGDLRNGELWGFGRVPTP